MFENKAGYGEQTALERLVDSLNYRQLFRKPLLLIVMMALREFEKQGILNEPGLYMINILSFKRYELWKFTGQGPLL